MARLRYALWPAGLILGVAAEWIGQPELTVLDAASGWALIFLGLVAWSRRSESGAGPIMAAAGFAWFLGTLWTPAVFLHRDHSRPPALVPDRQARVAPRAVGRWNGVRVRRRVPGR